MSLKKQHFLLLITINVVHTIKTIEYNVKTQTLLPIVDNISNSFPLFLIIEKLILDINYLLKEIEQTMPKNEDLISKEILKKNETINRLKIFLSKIDKGENISDDVESFFEQEEEVLPNEIEKLKKLELLKKILLKETRDKTALIKNNNDQISQKIKEKIEILKEEINTLYSIKKELEKLILKERSIIQLAKTSLEDSMKFHIKNLRSIFNEEYIRKFKDAQTKLKETNKKIDQLNEIKKRYDKESKDLQETIDEINRSNSTLINQAIGFLSFDEEIQADCKEKTNNNENEKLNERLNEIKKDQIILEEDLKSQIYLADIAKTSIINIINIINKIIKEGLNLEHDISERLNNIIKKIENIKTNISSQDYFRTNIFLKNLLE